MEEIIKVTFENLFTYAPVEYDVVFHVLTLGYAAQLGGLVFFLASKNSSAPKYRLSSILSAVVMASAFLELYVQADIWREAFILDPVTGQYVLGTATGFSNGFRYVNWSIDVPVLLTQLLIIVGLSGRKFTSNAVQFTIAGLLMIYTGYIGQFYEANAPGGGPTMPFYIWGAISTVFFFWILWLVYKNTYGALDRMPRQVHGMVKGVFWLLLVSWMLYPGAYLMPAFWFDAGGVVARQISYTVADITSKVIYGVLLTFIAQKLSAIEGYVPAQVREGDTVEAPEPARVREGQPVT